MVLDENEDTAYDLAVQIIGNAFIARRSMVDCSGAEFIDLVLSDASTALNRLNAAMHSPESVDHLRVVSALIESLRHGDRADLRAAVSAA